MGEELCSNAHEGPFNMSPHLCVLHMVCADALPKWTVCMCIHEHKAHREHAALMVRIVSFFTYAALRPRCLVGT